MIRNLVVGGCSFTKTFYEHEWALNLVREFNIERHVNLAESAAGNSYIADSLQNYLRNSSLDPAETLVIVMWSGPSRLDLTVSDEYFDMLQYGYKKKVAGKNYVFSGGELGTWNLDSLIEPVFHRIYQTKNINSFARDTITNVMQTKDFLTLNGFKFKFLSYVNYWADVDGFVSDMDLSIGFYEPKLAKLVKTDPNWIWTDNEFNCFYEFAKHRSLISEDGFHPNEQAHKEFTQEVLIPNLQEFFK